MWALACEWMCYDRRRRRDCCLLDDKLWRASWYYIVSRHDTGVDSQVFLSEWLSECMLCSFARRPDDAQGPRASAPPGAIWAWLPLLYHALKMSGLERAGGVLEDDDVNMNDDETHNKLNESQSIVRPLSDIRSQPTFSSVLQANRASNKCHCYWRSGIASMTNALISLSPYLAGPSIDRIKSLQKINAAQHKFIFINISHKIFQSYKYTIRPESASTILTLDHLNFLAQLCRWVSSPNLYFKSPICWDW